MNQPPTRTVFFVSDQTGVTAETVGHSLLTQFEGLNFQAVTLPFVSTLEKAEEARQRIDAAGIADGLRPIIFSTLVREAERDIVKRSSALFLDFFDAFVTPLESELGVPSSHAQGRAHGMFDLTSYMTRIDATNFALANDDGGRVQDYDRADVVLIGVSRSGKTPTCLYLALHYGIYAANFPLTEEDLDSEQLPASVRNYTAKLFGLTIEAERLQQIRQARRPDSRYSSAQQVDFELRAAERLYARFNVPYADTTHCSVEEISSRILQLTGVARRLRP
ncbi:MAG TPA: pyruvate, water dikinase regulatory protein [Steroidobacteraceae bacterium]